MVLRNFYMSLLTQYFPFIITMTVMFVLHARNSPYTTKPVPAPVPDTKYSVEDHNHHDYKPIPVPALVPVPVTKYCKEDHNHHDYIRVSVPAALVPVPDTKYSKEEALVPVPVTKYYKEDHNHHDYKRVSPPVPALVPVPDTKYTKEDQKIINDFFEDRKEWPTSNLGTYLFKHGIKLDKRTWNKSLHRVFNVVIWMHWKWLKRRHIDGFIEHDNNPLYGCSVSNCRFSGSTYYFAAADAVVIHIQKGLIPKVASRNPRQIWIFWVDESPKNAFSLSKRKPSFKELSNIFNWSMTYRTDSDVPIPYGRTVPLIHPKTHNLSLENLDHNSSMTILEELVPFWKDKRMKPGDVLATILISNCYSTRMRFLMKLKKYMNIDIYGGCAKDEYQRKRCPGHFRADCEILSRYLFYIVMENSKCRQYISEKSFHHAYSKGAIPVFVGPFLEDCKRLLPPNSFLHIDNFKTPEHLAVEIDAISKNATKLLSYHTWRNHFKVVNEHGYFGTMSAQMCRICEALNYNQRSQKVYGVSDIRRYLDPEIQCH